MHPLLTSPLLTTYGPLALAAVGVAAYSYFKRPPSGPSGVSALLDTIDDFALELMRDPGSTGLAEPTKKAFLEVAAAKGAVRKALPAA